MSGEVWMMRVMYIATVPNRSSPPAILLRESYREGNKVRTRTLANLSSLTAVQIDGMRRALKGGALVSPEEALEKVRDEIHGSVHAVAETMRRIGFSSLLDSRWSRERDLVIAMVTARIVDPESKLGTVRWWHTTTLARDLALQDADEEDAYAAMDWLFSRQSVIERKLAKRHIHEGAHALYDLSSSYFEGTTCPLAKLGHNRDGKRGKLQVNYGLLTDRRGCPVAVSVFAGNTADCTTVVPEVERIQQEFGVRDVVAVGDRGMISQKQITGLGTMEGVEWITALRTESIKKLVTSGALQLGLFDKRNLLAIEHPDFPGERLIACKNEELARLRAHKRESLLVATEAELDKIRARVKSGKLSDKAKIGVAVGRIVNKYKVAKHFEIEITDACLDVRRKQRAIADEASLDGIYVVRTSLPKMTADDAEAVRAYKDLANVERAFRTMKTMSLKVRPIHHRLEDRVRAHIFLCMLAFYVEWHMREAWRPILFSDEEQNAKQRRDPVAPAIRSESALRKVHSRKLDDDTVAHSFATLLDQLGTITRSTMRRKDPSTRQPTFTILTSPSPLHQKAFDLLAQIRL